MAGDAPIRHDQLNWFDRKRAEFGQFDLGALNAFGWLAFLSALSVVVAASLAVAGWVTGQGIRPGEKWGRWCAIPVAVGILLLAVGWFHLWKQLLGLAGLSVYRASRREPAAGGE